MDEFAEWGEGTTGIVAADSTYTEGLDFDEYREQLWQLNQRDAVVCLVDCNEGMFGALPAGESTTTTSVGKSGASSPARTRGVVRLKLSTTGHEATMGSGAVGDSDAAVGLSSSFFSMSMQSILALMKEKIICSSKDVVAIVLYNTRTPTPSRGFRGVYVIQEAARIGTECMQKVEQLEAAGAPGSAAYEEFKAHIGHWPTASMFPAPAAASSASGCAETNTALPTPLSASPAFKFSEALWEAQRIVLRLRTMPDICHRRLFVFTNRDNPSGDDAREWSLCRSRACDLGKEGVVLEVFGFGNAGSGGGPYPSGSSAVADTAGDAGQGRQSISSTASICADGTDRSSRRSSARPLFTVSSMFDQSLDPTTAATGANTGQSGPSQSDSPSLAETGFVPDFFWGPLLREMQAASARFSANGDSDNMAALTEARDEAFVSRGGGSINVNAGNGTLQQLLDSVMRRATAQRPFRHCLLRIGGFSGTATGSLSATTAAERDAERASRAAAVPQMAVSLYTPFVRARLPPREWLDKRTNRMLHRVVRLHARTNGGDGVDGGACAGHKEGAGDSRPNQLQRFRSEKDPTEELMTGQEDVQLGDLRYYAPAGKERVYFTMAERKRIVEVAAAGAEPGFTVLHFKDLVDAVKREHSVGRSSFLHSCVQRGGAHSHRLFVLFVRRLRAKKKVAIAQYCTSAGSAPRLVALVPSPDLTGHPERRDQVPVDGLGLYVVPLPYAEDLRAVPELRACTLTNKHATPVLEDSSVDPMHLELAKQLVSSLTVSYQVDGVLNPALQRQYRKLQELARRLFPLSVNPLYLDVETSLARVEEEDAGAEDTDEAPWELDGTLPDYEGMRSFAALFHSFNKEVLGNDYDAFLYCPHPRAAAMATRRPRGGAAEVSAAGGSTAVSTEEDGDPVPIEQVIRHAAAENAWEGLIIPQLKRYLTATNVSAGGARRKADLIELVKQHFPPPS
ncbi:KU70 protein, putative [Leishmania guyanensis]|uniref:KU70 protein, putative n=1 Tax=Leishmania guyanensis TaxID=5670 RepID=A0A1E1J0X2_LEIGU|nr:KU70 protein, putative [Leishmania guyanensis]